MPLNLWGEELTIQKTQDIAKRVQKQKKQKEISVKKLIDAKATTLTEKLRLIKDEVYRILGVYKNNTVVIRTKQELKDYIDASIQNGIIAVDTETNKSLDPLTCLLMGPCIYTPGQKQAYIPINHTDLQHNRLEEQLTENDIKEEFDRLKSGTTVLMHNGKFDYQVIHCTCGCDLPVHWDTLIGAKMLNENEEAGLKQQYISKIDPSIEKYSIEHLFKTVDYEYVDPEVFALYAATDAYMTYKLYEWQKSQFELVGNEKIYDVFLNIEMKALPVFAQMELDGVKIDVEYAKKISQKYHSRVKEMEKQIEDEVAKYNDQIQEWRKSQDATTATKQYITDKIAEKLSKEEIAEKFPFEDELGRYKLGKTKGEQLSDPVAISSPTQLAILLYDIFKLPSVDKKTPRGTGSNILEKLDHPITKLLVEWKKLEKLITAFIDPLPTEFLSDVDGKVHCSYKQIGAATGRVSCTEPNLQQVPLTLVAYTRKCIVKIA